MKFLNKNPGWRPEAFVDGNLLVVHPTFVDPGLWEEILGSF